MSMFSKSFPKPRRGWPRITTSRGRTRCCCRVNLFSDARSGLRVENVQAFGPNADRYFLTWCYAWLDWSNCDDALASRQRQVDDLLVAHRLDDPDFRAQRAVSARAFADYLEMLGTNAEEHPVVCSRLAWHSDRKIRSAESAHPAGTRAR